MEVKDVYEKLNGLLCNQSEALKKLVWVMDHNQKLNKPKNVLLVGELGSGKSTMVEMAANMMNIPEVGVSGLFNVDGVNLFILYNALARLVAKNECQSCKGIVLVHDMKDVFLYGGFTTLNSIITSGTFIFENKIFDLSKTMFIGEIDNNGFEDCFIKKPIYTVDNMEEAIYSSDYSGDQVRELISNLLNLSGEDDVSSDMYTEQFREAIRRTFLSPECCKAFNKKIFMDSIGFENIKKALRSPVSELQTYSDDLSDEYMASPHFIDSVASHISESLVGLHDLDDAVHDVVRYDSRRKIKVFKEKSLMRL